MSISVKPEFFFIDYFRPKNNLTIVNTPKVTVWKFIQKHVVCENWQSLFCHHEKALFSWRKLPIFTTVTGSLIFFRLSLFFTGIWLGKTDKHSALLSMSDF